MLAQGDSSVWQAIGTSLAIAGWALLLATPIAIAIAYLLASNDFIGKGAIIACIHALLATPTVLVGLILYLLLSRQGPLGALELLFTPAAISIGQFIIALPILTAFSYATLNGNIQIISETARSLGANNFQTSIMVIKESRHGLSSALLAGFGRIISEVGCALIIGGNIAGSTRTMPTAIAVEISRGLFAKGIALGIVLLLLAVVASSLLALLQGKNRVHQ